MVESESWEALRADMARTTRRARGDHVRPWFVPEVPPTPDPETQTEQWEAIEVALEELYAD